MWELDHKENWMPKNWCFWTVVLEKTLESPLDCKIKPVHPKGNQSWIFIRRTDAEAETPTLWLSDAKSWLFRKDPDAGKEWRQEEKGTTGNQMVGWHHWPNGHEFEQALGNGEGQGSLACCSPWVEKGQTWLSDWTTAEGEGNWRRKRGWAASYLLLVPEDSLIALLSPVFISPPALPWQVPCMPSVTPTPSRQPPFLEWVSAPRSTSPKV